MRIKDWTAALVLAVMAGGAAAAQEPRVDAEQIRSRQRLSTMEGVLERAVRNGADSLLRQMEAVLPDAAMLTGSPRARGFRLQGYGVFFDVEVPPVELSLAWPLRSLINDTRAAGALLDKLKAEVALVNPRERESLMQVVRQLEMTLPLAPPTPGRSGVPAVSAAALTSGAPPSPPPPVAPVDPDVLDDPLQAWRNAVKTALIEAMLENSGPLGVSPEEWLTVAALRSPSNNPVVSAASLDSTTVYLRVKGSDLADFHARRITLSEAIERVEVREE